MEILVSKRFSLNAVAQVLKHQFIKTKKLVSIIPISCSPFIQFPLKVFAINAFVKAQRNLDSRLMESQLTIIFGRAFYLMRYKVCRQDLMLLPVPQ